MSESYPFVKHKYTLNMDSGDGFTCLACGHWLYESETEWGDLYVCNPSHPKRFGHIHGHETFHFCPQCGAMVLSLSEWVNEYPQDQNKTISDIARRFYE